jgi:Surface-adhesin protein E
MTSARLLIALLGLMVSATARAEWVNLGTSPTATWYIDSATIRKEAHLRKAWVLNDLKQRARDGDLSRRGLYEFDCKEGRVRILTMYAFSGKMATGQGLGYEKSDVWVDVAPGTANGMLLEYACAR